MTQLLPPLASPGVSFVTELDDHGSRVAIVDRDGHACSYADLDARVAEFAQRLGHDRRLTMVRMSTTLDSIVGYLGALRAGHAVVVVDDAESSDRIEATHAPDVVVHGSSVEEHRAESAHDLHPDLALLLSTSGSTGSPKLVRLSHRNVESNAGAIARYLSLTHADRAITTLPLHYCFGLSVLHSHLAAGASIALSSASVVDPCFWETVARTRPTMLAAVPHTIDLLDRVGFPDRVPDSLRAVIQAGGRLDPAHVRRYADAGERAGWELYVMYGQTEATARMAYLPPTLAAERPDAVGVPVDGGRFEIVPFGGAAPGTGEIVYHGPNVMMGYAETPDDLARGHEHDRLRTGDVGRIAADGLLEIVGRRSDFVKVFGLRVDLGRARQIIDEAGIAGRVDGDDEGIVVALTGEDADPASIRSLISDRLSIPRSVVATSVVDGDALARLSNGKIDRVALRAMVRAGAPDGPANDGPARDGPVRSIYRRVIGCSNVEADDTFVGLGGDSLSYVEVSIALERALTHLPDDWHLHPVGELDQLTSHAPRRRLPRVETNVVLRAMAIVAIVGNHASLFLVPGGAHLLFAGAGFNYARFQAGPGARWRSLLRLAAPCVLWIGGAAALSEDFTLTHGLLVHGWLDGDGRWMYWFVEALVQVLVVLAAAFSVPVVRRLEQRAPFAFACGLLGVALTPVVGLVSLPDLHHGSYRPHEILWLFALGWAIARSSRAVQRLGLSAVAWIVVPEYFGDSTRTVVLLVGLAVLIWVPRIAVPRHVDRLVGALAGASLYIYLTHVQVYPSFDRPAAGVVVSLIVGIVAWRIATPALAHGEAALRRISPRIRRQMQPSRI